MKKNKIFSLLAAASLLISARVSTTSYLLNHLAVQTLK